MKKDIVRSLIIALILGVCLAVIQSCAVSANPTVSNPPTTLGDVRLQVPYNSTDDVFYQKVGLRISIKDGATAKLLGLSMCWSLKNYNGDLAAVVREWAKTNYWQQGDITFLAQVATNSYCPEFKENVDQFSVK